MSTQRDLRISVKNFGPIMEGAVDLRPLSIFVGPSNTGKTYLAILIYALHRILQGFPRIPVLQHKYFAWGEDESQKDVNFENLVSKLNDDEEAVFFSDFPKPMRDYLQNVLKHEVTIAHGDTIENGDTIADELRIELERCFDLESVEDLIQVSEKPNIAELSVEVREADQELWNYMMRISGSRITAGGNIKDIEVLSDRRIGLRTRSKKEVRLLRRHLINQIRGIRGRREFFPPGLLWEILHHPLRDTTVKPYYLPAARSGIMQSHRVIAGALVKRSARAGLERVFEIPRFSGVLADFIQQLIFYEPRSSIVEDLSQHQSLPAIIELANVLERTTLDGHIHASKSSPGAYPEFVYSPQEAKQNIRLSRASSMVSELAPVVLFLRGSISQGDTLIIEEPEAHLHPAAQTEMAAALARMARCGIRVVITTHSDWLLKEIGNLMREGELEEHIGQSPNKDRHQHSLRPQDVGVWLFHKDKGAQGSTVREINFDRIEGIEPEDYEDIAEHLYNRSAALQNQFEETSMQNSAQT